MVTLRALFGALVACLIALCNGCASSGVWFATTKMDMTEYRQKQIVVLPVVGLQGVEVSDAMKTGLQDAVKNGLTAFAVRLRDVRVVSESDLAAKNVPTEFPWTPARVAAASRALVGKADTQVQTLAGADETAVAGGAIGISVTAVAPRIGKEPAAISVIFVFADQNDANGKRWAIAGTWSDLHLDHIADDVKAELGSYFVSLKWLARTGDSVWVEEKYDARQPFVTVFGPSGTFEDSLTTVERTLQLQVTGIHDDGIDSLEIRNDAGGTILLPARLASDVKGPIYYSSYVNVPLAFGQNTIHISAHASNGTSTLRRPISVRCTTPARMHVLALGISDYDDFDPVPGAASAAGTVVAALSRLSPLQTSVYLSTDKKAIESVADGSLEQIQLNTAPGDQVVFYFAGRLVTSSVRRDKQKSSERKLFFALSDAMPGSPGLGSITPRDLDRLLIPNHSVGVLDVCLDDSSEDLGGVLRTTLPRNVIGRVSACDASVGQLGSAIARWSSLQKSQSPNVADLAAWITQQNIPGVFVGSRDLAVADAAEQGVN